MSILAAGWHLAIAGRGEACEFPTNWLGRVGFVCGAAREEEIAASTANSAVGCWWLVAAEPVGAWWAINTDVRWLWTARRASPVWKPSAADWWRLFGGVARTGLEDYFGSGQSWATARWLAGLDAATEHRITASGCAELCTLFLNIKIATPSIEAAIFISCMLISYCLSVQ